MEPTDPQPSTHDDPTSAFAALRGEVSLLRRAVEGLTAERQTAPDYTPTLTELAGRLGRVEGFLGKVSESPAMRLTPDNLAVSIARASESVRAGDRENLGKADAVLRAAVGSINAVVEQAWTADRQWKHLYWTGGGSFVLGIMGTLSILHFVS